MTAGEEKKRRHRILKAAVLPLVMCMTFLEWTMDVLQTLNRWLIRPFAILILLSGGAMMLLAEEDWRFYLPAFAVGMGLLFVAPAAHALREWIGRVKQKLIGAVY